MTDRLFCHFGPYFAFLLPWRLRKSKFWKNTWRSYHFTHVYLKLQSYDVWFLSYGVWRTDFFCHFGPFFVLLPTTRKMKILKKWKKCMEISSFYTSLPWITIIWCMVPAIWSVTDRFFCHSWTFFAFLPEDIIILRKATTNHMLHCSW